jgi:hypothetical protein
MSTSYVQAAICRRLAAALPLLALLAAACSDSTSPGPSLATIDVTPPADTVEVGQTVQLQATPLDQSGDVLDGQSIAWSSADEDVASISTSGMVTGLAPGGPVTMTATSGGVSGSAAVLVRSDCTDFEPIELGESLTSTLSTTDCRLGDGSFTDLWSLDLSSAADVRITMSSTAVDAYLGLVDLTTGQIVAEDDDSGGGTDALIEISLGAGAYLILANSFDADETGTYTLAVTEVSASQSPGSAAARWEGRQAPAGTHWADLGQAKPLKR